MIYIIHNKNIIFCTGGRLVAPTSRCSLQVIVCTVTWFSLHRLHFCFLELSAPASSRVSKRGGGRNKRQQCSLIWVDGGMKRTGPNFIKHRNVFESQLKLEAASLLLDSICICVCYLMTWIMHLGSLPLCLDATQTQWTSILEIWRLHAQINRCETHTEHRNTPTHAFPMLIWKEFSGFHTSSKHRHTHTHCSRGNREEAWIWMGELRWAR